MPSPPSALTRPTRGASSARARRSAAVRSSASRATTRRRSRTCPSSGCAPSSTRGPSAPRPSARSPTSRSSSASRTAAREIGVTLPHPHGQIYAYPYLPTRTKEVLEAAQRHHDRTGRLLGADILAAEQADGSRIVVSGTHWTAYVPFAARWPVEVHLAPHRDVPDLVALDDDERDELAVIYRDLLGRLDRYYVAEDGPGQAALHRGLAAGARPDRSRRVAAAPAARVGAAWTGAASSSWPAPSPAWAAGSTTSPPSARRPASARSPRERARPARRSSTRWRLPSSGRSARHHRACGRHRAASTSSASTPTTTAVSASRSPCPTATYAAVSRRDDGVLRMASAQQDGVVEVALDEISPEQPGGWGAYVAGVPGRFARRVTGSTSRARRLDVPLGAGLSSSAALECAVAAAASDLYGLGLLDSAEGRARLAARCVEAENVIAGAPTGGMDQSASLLCDEAAGAAARLPLGRHRAGALRPRRGRLRLLVTDTRAEHALVDGQYAARRDACERRRRDLGVATLREIAPTDLAGRARATRLRRGAAAGASRRHRDRARPRRGRGAARPATSARSAGSSTPRTRRCATTTRSRARSSTSPPRRRAPRARSAPG